MASSLVSLAVLGFPVNLVTSFLGYGWCPCALVGAALCSCLGGTPRLTFRRQAKLLRPSTGAEGSFGESSEAFGELAEVFGESAEVFGESAEVFRKLAEV